MDALGSIKPVVSTPTPVKAASVPVLPKPQASPAAGGLEAQVSFDVKAAESRRLEALANAARNAPQPLGSQVFTMFKDGTGQMVTRFRDTNSGKVTYIPEPTLISMTSGASHSEALVNIKV